MIELTGARRVVRQAAFLAVIGSGLVVVVAYFLPALWFGGVFRETLPSPAPDEFHSNFDEYGVMPVIVLVASVCGMIWLRKRRFGAGFLATVVVVFGLLVIVVTVQPRVFWQQETTWGEPVFEGALRAFVLTSLALPVVELVVFLLEGRRVSTRD